MVLPLVNLSLRSVTKGIKDGTIRHPHLLSPMVRERVLDMAIKEELFEKNPNCLNENLLTSVEFLNGLTSISAETRSCFDLEFLERLVSSLATKLPNGETVGATIKNLNITVSDCDDEESYFENKTTYSVIISRVSDLIGQCPNLASLDLHVSKSSILIAKDGYWPLNKNENSACTHVMENLINLSVALFDWADIIDTERPIINFKKLTTLKLDKCIFIVNSWPKLLEKIPFLENLHLIGVYSDKDELDLILPFPLPHLKTLEVIGGWSGSIFECNKAFVYKLVDCPRIRHVHLKLDETSTDEESLARLAKMNIVLKMKIELNVYGDGVAETAAVFDSSWRFKLVRIFHESLESFVLSVHQGWDAQFSKALEDVFNTCSKLTSFGITQPRFRLNQAQVECSEEKKRFNTALIRFFGTPERTRQLKDLQLHGNLDETVLSAVFENCLNLVRLGVFNCSTLRDQHLIDWVARGGGKLADFSVFGCSNLTSEGIIPMLAISAENLLLYRIHLNEDNGGRNWETVLRNRCPNAVFDDY